MARSILSSCAKHSWFFSQRVNCINVNHFRMILKHRNIISPFLILECKSYGTKIPSKNAKGKKGKPKVRLNEDDLKQVIDVDLLTEMLTKSVDGLKTEYVKQLSLRTSTSALESLPVKVEGAEYALNEVAQLAKKNPQLVVINVSSTPQAVKSIVDAISQSGMNLNPQLDGTTVYVTIPKVTKEHRESLSRSAKTLFLKTKENIQSIQNRFVKEAKKQKDAGLSEDLVFNTQQHIMAIANNHIEQAEKLLVAKQDELLGKN